MGIDLTRAEFYIPEAFTMTGASYTWVGGMTYPMYIPAQERVINTPKEAIEAFSGGWNELFRKESLDELADFTKKKITNGVTTTMGPTKSDGAATWFHMESGSTKETTMTEATVAEMVKGYPAAALGMVMIADRFSKEDEEGCFWPVLYDKDYAVVWTERMCGETRGLGLRNFYYSPVKEILEQIEDARKKEW
jgi:hypothetical protein